MAYHKINLLTDYFFNPIRFERRSLDKRVKIFWNPYEIDISTSVTRLSDILDFGQLFKAFGDN